MKAKCIKKVNDYIVGDTYIGMRVPDNKVFLHNSHDPSDMRGFTFTDEVFNEYFVEVD
jgi:hypothetical protein